MAERRPLPVSEPESEEPEAKKLRLEESGEGTSGYERLESPEDDGSEEKRVTETSAILEEAGTSRDPEKLEKKSGEKLKEKSGEKLKEKSGEKLEEKSGEKETSLEESIPGSSSGSEKPETAALASRIMGQETGSPGRSGLVGEHAHYQEMSLLGDGAYGTVYKAKDLTTGQVVALKKVRVPLTEDGLPTSTLREIAGLKQLERFEHPHIVRLLDVCQGTYLQSSSSEDIAERVDRSLTLWLVFEHVEQDLASYLASRAQAKIPADQVRRMSREILLGVDFLHSHRIIHRDLKPQNLLVTSEGRIKIADFGLAKTYDFEMRLTSVVVTLWYRAPEVLLGCSYATPVDLWSVGCILAEINRLQPLFPGTSEGDQLDRIFQIIGTPSRDNWPENVSLSWTAFPHRQARPLRSLIPELDDQGLDLIKNLLTFDPHVRLSAAQALAHRYFADTET